MPVLAILILLIGLGNSAFTQHLPVHIPPIPAGIIPHGLNPTKPVSQYKHFVWKTEQGLPQNSALDICQTRDGYLWIATQEGLARFDGARFVVFDKNNTPAFKSSWVSRLLQDRTGRLWIGTRGGLLSWHNGNFMSYTAQNGVPINNIVLSLLEDQDGALWIGTRGDGLLCLRNGTVTKYTTRNGLSSNDVWSLLQDSTGVLWIGTAKGLDILRNGAVINYGAQIRLPTTTVNDLVQDYNGAIWVGMQSYGLGCLRNGVFTCYTTRNGLAHNDVYRLLQDPMGTLWIGTGGGLNRLCQGDHAGNTITSYTTANGLSHDVVISLLQDREGALWVGTEGGGINQFSSSIFTNYSTAGALSSNAALSLLQDRSSGSNKGAVWVGSQGGLNRLQNGIITTYTTKDGLSDNAVESLLQEHDNKGEGGVLWIGTRGGGLNRFDNGKFTTYTTQNGLLKNVVRALLQDRNSNSSSHTKQNSNALWIGAYDGGLNFLCDGVFKSYTTKEGLSSNAIRALLQDREGALWIGTVGGGLNRFKDGIFTNYTTQNGMATNVIRCLLEDSSEANTLWIGTQGGGLHRFKDGKFIVFTVKDGLFDDTAFCILEDGLGWLWMTCNKGVYRVRKSDLSAFADGKIQKIPCESFGKADGMKSAECGGGSPAGMKSMDGNLWFPTMAGVVAVDPRNLFSNPLPPPVMIEEIKADNILIDLSTAPTLAASIEKLEFRYTATSLLFPERVKFKFLLEGYDKTWVDAGVRRVAYYTSLPRGRQYRFRVQACNNNGVWNEVGAAAMFYLTPYFWETWQFYSLCGVSIIAVGYGAVRWRLRRIQALAKELERVVEQRTAELSNANIEIRRQLEIQAEQAREIEEANVALQNKNLVLEQVNREKNDSIKELESFSYTVAHDLRTPLRAIGSFSQIFLDDYSSRLDSDGLRLLNTVTNNAEKMSILIDALLLVSRIGRQTLKPAMVNMTQLVHSAVAEMNHDNALKDYTFEIEDLPEVYCDAVLIKQVWSHLLSNAVKYSRNADERRITIGALGKEKQMVYFIQDRGAGFDMRHINKLFQVFQRLHKEADFEGTGVELTIVHRIISKHGGTIWAEAEVGKGSTFYFTLLTPQM